MKEFNSFSIESQLLKFKFLLGMLILHVCRRRPHLKLKKCLLKVHTCFLALEFHQLRVWNLLQSFCNGAIISCCSERKHFQK